MAVTAGGTPYVESSDLVANYPGASLALANRVDQVMQAPTQNAQTGTTYTAALLDAGKTVTLSNASAVTVTIPAQATVAWAENTQLNFLNIGAGTVTITPAATVTINGTPLTLATSKGGSLVRTASNTWTFTPTGGGGGGGKILQVVSVVKSDTFTSTSTSLVDITGLSATITPSSSDSKILVFSSVNGSQDVNEARITLLLLRGTSPIFIGDAVGSRLRRSASFGSPDVSIVGAAVNCSFLDSPATLSAVTYKWQGQMNAGGGGFFINRTEQDTNDANQSRFASTITLMEVGP